MSTIIKVTVHPDKINAEDEEAINQAVTNALIVQKGFFPSSDYLIKDKNVQVVVVIETPDPNVSPAQKEFLEHLLRVNLAEEYQVYGSAGDLRYSRKPEKNER